MTESVACESSSSGLSSSDEFVSLLTGGRPNHIHRERVNFVTQNR